MTKIPFSELGLTPEIERAVAAMGFETPTDVQAEAIPPIREGRDVVARSQTGTGKTLAYAIPAIERIDTGEKSSTVQVLVLCPTRELAMQSADEVRKLARYIPEIRPVEVYGGADITKQCIRLRSANIVVGTPGRIMDHLRRKTLKLSNLKMLVLDEADEMLDMGFKEDIETILRGVPEERQTVLFSATMPPAILALTKDFQRSPVTIDIDSAHATLDEIKQEYLEVPHSAKMAALLSLMEFHRKARTLVFCNTKTMVDEITGELNARGFAAEGIHSDIRQSQRTSVMADFKQGRTEILVATDIAARGIDVSGIDFVINFDLPTERRILYPPHRPHRPRRALRLFHHDMRRSARIVGASKHRFGDQRQNRPDPAAHIRGSGKIPDRGANKASGKNAPRRAVADVFRGHREAFGRWVFRSENRGSGAPARLFREVFPGAQNSGGGAVPAGRVRSQAQVFGKAPPRLHGQRER